MPTTPAGDFLYYRDLVDANGTSIAGGVCALDLTASNFDFTKVQPNGADFAVYDLTAGANVPHWLRDFDPAARLGRLFFKATNTGRSHRLYYGNSEMAPVVNFPGVYLHGTGFDADWGDLATATAGTNAQCDRVPAAGGWTDPRRRRIWRRMKTPQIAGNVNGPNYVGVRDVAFTTDRYGQIVEDTPGVWVAYYGNEANPGNGLSRRTMRATSTDRGMTWTNHTQILLPDQIYDSLGVIPGSVIKVASNSYYMWCTATGTNVDQPHMGGIEYLTSTDNLNWTRRGITIPANTTQIVDYTCASMAVPRVKVMRDGKWTMFCESRPFPGNFKVVGFTATSPDGPWTAMNSGHVVLDADAAMWWRTDGVANPYVDELDDGSGYLLFTNGAIGHVNTTDYNWQTGFLTASTYNGPYTQDAHSPPFGRPLNWYGLETSVLAIDAATRERVTFVQDYGTSAGVDNEPSVFRVWPITDRGGLMVTTAVSDGSIAGRALASGAFTAESVSWMTAHRSEDSTQYLLSLIDVPALPPPNTSTSLAGIFRLTIKRTTFANASPGDIQFNYRDASNVAYVWNGTAWATTGSATAATSDPNRPIRATISDDGGSPGNYVFKAAYDDDGTLLASASIAKTSVGSFANPRFLLVGDLFTNATAGGLFFRQIGVRPFAAIEPSITVGMEIPTTPVAPGTASHRLLESGSARLLEGGGLRLLEAGAPVPAAGHRLLESGASRLLESGSFRLLEAGAPVPTAGHRLLENGASRLLEGGGFRLLEAGAPVPGRTAGRRLLESGAARLLEGGGLRLLEGSRVLPPGQLAAYPDPFGAITFMAIDPVAAGV